MRRLLNILFVTSHGSYLSREGETVFVQVEGQTRLRLPIHTLSGVVCFGRVMCTPPLSQLCAKLNVTVSVLSEHGRFWARVHGPVSGNLLLRRERYRSADDEGTSANVSRAVVVAKVANSRTVLLRAIRRHSGSVDTARLDYAARNLARIRGERSRPTGLDKARGYEGEAAKLYFDVFDHLIVAQKDDFFFRGGNRRPPLDNMNSLLSFLYTLLTYDVVSCLEAVGLDPAVGFIYQERPGRPGSAFDLMEEFRPFLADRLALSLVNRQQVKGKGFKTTETGAVIMDDETRKTLLVAYQKRKQEKIRHRFLDEKMAVVLLPYAQALLFARYLWGKLKGILLSCGSELIMLVLVTYDVNTETPVGRKRLRRVGKACENIGQRAQESVFECLVDPTQWAILRQRLIDEIESESDRLRFYFLGKNWKLRVEHVGAKPGYDPEGSFIV